jgi:hypothetical protein
MSALFISQSLWHPLVHISDNQIGLMVQPGSNIPAVRLGPGWQWHWPLLTTIRCLDSQLQEYPINQLVKINQRQLGDEPIIAATKDLSLVSIQGKLQLQINQEAPIDLLAKLNPHSINRVIRPLIRQCVRQIMAGQPHPVHNQAILTKEIATLLLPALSRHGILVRQLDITSINPYHPQIAISPVLPK